MADKKILLLDMIAPHKGRVIASILLSAFGQFCGIVPFILIYIIVEKINLSSVASFDLKGIWTLIFTGICAIMLKYILSGIATHISHVVAYNALYDLRIKISKKLATLPLGYFNTASSGQIKKIMLEDVEQMEVFIGHNIPELIGGLLYLVITLLVLFIFDWRLALATICLLPLGIIVQSMTMKKTKPLQEKYFTANENTNTAMIQYIQGMFIIKVFGHALDSFKKYAESVRACADYEARISKIWIFPSSFSSVISNGALLVLLPLGGVLYLQNAIVLSTFVFFMLMGLGIGNFLTQLMMMGSYMEINLEGQARITALLDETPLPENEVSILLQGNDVCGKSIAFSYGENKVLENVDFAIPEGAFVALVGPSGAGKTTLARLIPRFWDVQSGKITLGGNDIRHMPLSALMEKMTFIFQDVFLFNDTIADNIRMGKPNATQDEIEAAAKAACCHDFIIALPDGYQHMVGEKGGRLSGGEKQRISIARAFLKNAPIVIMDEATSSVDSENQVLIQQAINALVQSKTLIVIAHRLSTIIHAHKIFVIDKGAIIACGTHIELLKICSQYKNMWEMNI